MFLVFWLPLLVVGTKPLHSNTVCDCDYGNNRWFSLMTGILLAQKNAMEVDRIARLYAIDCHNLEILDTYGDSVGARSVEETHSMILRSFTKPAPWVPLFAYRLCAPGQVAQGLFCAAYWHQRGDDQYLAWLQISDLFFRAVSSCLHLDYERKFALDRERAEQIIYGGEDPSFDFLSVDGGWSEFLRSCVPLLPQCFPAVGLTAGDSCLHCCDPNFVNEDCASVDRQLCCHGTVSTAGTADTAPPVEILQVERIADFKNAAGKCKEFTEFSEPLPTLDQEGRLWSWLSGANSSAQEIFPELDLFVTKNVCVDRDTGVWWRQANETGELGKDDTLEIVGKFGGVCGSGVRVDGEVVSEAVDGKVICPKNTRQGNFTFDVFPVSVFPVERREISDSQRVSGLTLLGGQLHNNIWHFMQDALFLKKAKNILGERRILFSKYSDSICFTDGSRCYTNPNITVRPWGGWQTALHAVLKIGNFSFSKDLPNQITCFDAVAQPWRHLPGNQSFYEEIRLDVLRHCELSDERVADKRTLVILDRGSKFRRWHGETLAELREVVKVWAVASEWQVKIVRLGKLSFCEQVKEMHQADIVLGVGGADMANALFMRRGAALIEVEAFCHVNRLAVENAIPAKLCRSSQTGIVDSRCPPSADASTWRGPGLEFNGSVHHLTNRKFYELTERGECPGYPLQSGVHERHSATGYRGDLARSKGLLYTAITQCECVEIPGSEQDCMHPFKQGDIKVDVMRDILPVIDIFAKYYSS